jgi:endonuclease/exonuclease/phosphatase family metal-dependent hydrolase
MSTGVSTTRRTGRRVEHAPGPVHPPAKNTPPRWARWLGPLVVAGIICGHVAVVGSVRHQTEYAEGVGLNGAAGSLDSRRASFRVATFNIHSGRNVYGEFDLGRTAAAMQGLDLDLVGLNEVRGAFPWDDAGQAELLGRQMNLPWLFVPSEERWWHDDFGNALLCRLPVERWQRTPLPCTQTRGMRTALVAETRIAGRTVRVLVTHIDRRRDREPQVRLIVDWFLGLPAPAILIGDLNTTRDNPHIQRMLHAPGVRDPLWDTRADQSPRRIDWIVTRGLNTLTAGVNDSNASDHALYWAELELPR